MFLIIKKNKQRGFSIIEALLYVVLLAIVTSVIVQMLISLSGVYKNIKLTRELESSGTIVMESILSEVRNASNVVLAESVFGVDLGTLTLSGIDPNDVAYELSFDVSSSTVRVAKDGATPIALSSMSATTSILTFTYVSNSHAQGVRVILQMSGVAGSSYQNKKFYGFAVLRGSY